MTNRKGLIISDNTKSTNASYSINARVEPTLLRNELYLSCYNLYV